MTTSPVYFVRPRFVDNFAKTFQDVAEAGIERIVLAPRLGDIDFMVPEHFEKAKGMLKELGLNPLACHGFFGGRFNLNAADGESRAQTIQTHCQYMRLMAELGCRTCVYHPGQTLDAVSREASWDCIRRLLDDLVPTAAKSGMVIALENALPGDLGDNARELFDFVDGYACETVKLCYDSGHAHVSETAESVLETFSPLLATVHLHDNDAINDQHLIPGRGTIDWQAIVARLGKCPELIHVETEAFNIEKWAHRELYEHYCKLLNAR